MTELERIEEDLVWLHLMLEFTEKDFANLQLDEIIKILTNRLSDMT